MPQNLLTAEGLVAAPDRSNTEELPNHYLEEENTKFPQHKPHSYRAEQSDNKNTAVTAKAAFIPQFNALHSFKRSYNAKERIKRQITVIRNTTSCKKSK